MLKSADGRPVRMARDYHQGHETPEFAVENGDGTYTKVFEAVVSEGDDLEWTEDHVKKALKLAGLDWLNVRKTDNYGWQFRYPEYRRRNRSSWGHDECECWESFSNMARLDERQPNEWSVLFAKGGKVTIDGREIPDFAKLVEMGKALGDIAKWDDLKCNYAFYGCFGKRTVTVQVVLLVIGAGKAVTPASLLRGCAKDESRPRLMVGDTVKFKKGNGVVLSFTATGANIQTSDGKKCSAKPETVERIDAGNVKAPDIEQTLADSFAAVLARKELLYRATTKTVGHISIPMFPAEDQKAREMVNAVTCTCPVCGWQLVMLGNENFECCFCRQTAIVVSHLESEVVLRLNRMPSKNQFAIREARCCGNCGNFRFEVGRQGKRSTGYCRTSNQVLQGFNTCDFWFPRDAEAYGANMRQHVTNLGYGVSDSRNTSRNDIRDTIYRKEDHDVQKKRAEDARTAYTVAYAKFLEELRAEGQKLPLTGETVDDETKARYAKILDGGV